MNSVHKKRKISSDVNVCKYGADCYRQNPEHRKQFHSSEEKTKTLVPDITSKEALSNGKENLDKLKSRDPDETDGELLTVENKIPTKASSSDLKFVETVQEVLDNMPKDFFDFWKFCSSLNQSKPEEAFAELGFHLVGIYDLLSKKLPAEKTVALHCHWRYYYDPPEFQTIIKLDGKDLYHIGYFRDEPNKMPSILACNSAKIGAKLNVMGDNIFAAMNSAMTESMKNSKNKKLNTKFKSIQEKLKKFAAKEKYNLEIQSSIVKARNKKVVAKTFHGLGIVVPVVNDVGYRPLPDSDTTLKNILKKIVSAESESQRLDEEENLDELISNVQFANDECDYGMGLELSIDLFCFGDPYFHSHISNLLPLAYELLKKPKYGEIVKQHLLNRRLCDELNELDT